MKRFLDPRTLLAVAVLCLAPLVWFAPVIVGGKTLAPADNLFQFQPWAALSQAYGVAEVVFRHRGDTLEWVRLENSSAETADDREPLLDGVRALRWRFLAGDGWTNQWPPAGTGTSVLPAAVELNLELADTGVLTRIHALR